VVLKCSHRRNQSLAFTWMHEQLLPHPPYCNKSSLLSVASVAQTNHLLHVTQNRIQEGLSLQWRALWTPDLLCSPYIHIFRSPALWSKVQYSGHTVTWFHKKIDPGAWILMWPKPWRTEERVRLLEVLYLFASVTLRTVYQSQGKWVSFKMTVTC